MHPTRTHRLRLRGLLLLAVVAILLPPSASAHQSGIVQRVVPGSAAEQAGLRQGDRIVRFDERVLETTDDLDRLVAAHRPGDQVTIVVGDWVYGSSGVTTPAFLMAVDARTGTIAWRERGFAKANCLAADGKLLILDEDGTLALASASPAGLTVHARTRLFEQVAWTVPTLVGRTLYARDLSQIVAVDLGEPAKRG